MSSSRARAAWSTAFLAPGVGILTLFIIVPILLTLWISLHQWSMLTPLGEMKWVGLSNFARVLQVPSFFRAITNTLVYSGVSLVLTVPIAVALGIFLYRVVLYGTTLVRGLLFATYIVPTVAVALIWSLLYSPLYGPFNQMLQAVGLRTLDFLGSPRQALASLIVFNLWQTLGYYTILVIAGLTQIPQELLDAAALDGANALQRAWHVIIPLLRRAIVFIVVIVIVNTVQVFDPVYVLTSGGPVNSTNVVAYEVFLQAFNFGQAGVASAMAVVLVLILVVLVGGLMWLLRGSEA